MSDVTQLLNLTSQGDASAEEQLLGLVHDELKRIATRRMSGEAPGHTLQTTALVNEAYIRLLGKKPPTTEQPTDVCEADTTDSPRWDSRAHFFAAAAEAMRRILIDNARNKKRQKRGGNNRQVPLDDFELAVESNVDLELLDSALSKFESENPQQAAVVKLKYFAGMTIDQTAAALGISSATVKRNWNYARAWLRREMGDDLGQFGSNSK